MVAPITAPINICGNAVAVIGVAVAGCKGGAGVHAPTTTDGKRARADAGRPGLVPRPVSRRMTGRRTSKRSHRAGVGPRSGTRRPLPCDEPLSSSLPTGGARFVCPCRFCE
ncbi:hypothetical protein ACFQ0B_12855 [Nonomuraea thailandensis]